jgi:hypothetical protein
MESPKIWMEMAIGGFVYLAAGFFFVLTLIHESSLVFLSEFQASAAVISIAVVLLSYVIGLAIHTISQRMFSKYNPNALSRSTVIFSNRVPYEALRLVETSYSTFALFRLLWPGTYYLGIAVLSWGCQSQFTRYRTASAICCFLLSSLFLWTYLSMRKPQAELEDRLGMLLRSRAVRQHPQAAALNKRQAGASARR